MSQELHTVWIGEKLLKDSDLNYMKKLSEKNVHIKQFVWMDRSPTEEEKQQLSAADVTPRHVKDLYLMLSQNNNEQDKQNLALLVELAKLESNTKYGKAFANNIIKELILFNGGSDGKQHYCISKDMGARFLNNTVPNIAQIVKTGDYRKEIFKKNNYLVNNDKSTPVLFGKKNNCGLYISKIVDPNSKNVKETLLCQYAFSDWSKVYDISTTLNNSWLSYNSSEYALMDQDLKKNENIQKYSDNELLLAASRNIKYREIWAAKHAALTSHMETKYTNIKSEIRSHHAKQIMVDLKEPNTQTVSVKKMKNMGDAQYQSAIMSTINHPRFITPSVDLNYDNNKGIIEQNRNKSWIPQEKPDKLPLIQNQNQRQRADSVIVYSKNDMLDYKNQATLAVNDLIIQKKPSNVSMQQNLLEQKIQTNLDEFKEDQLNQNKENIRDNKVGNKIFELFINSEKQQIVDDKQQISLG